MKSRSNKKSFLAIVFSRDRALQLEGMLKSYFLNCQDYQESAVYIIYTASSSRYEAQYQLLKNQFKEFDVHFICEGNFQNDFNHLVYRYGTANKLHDLFIHTLLHLKHRFIHRHSRIFLLGRAYYLFFAVDDSLFINPFSLGDIDQCLQEHPDSIGFSLRLGLNTDYCYMYNANQATPPFEELPGGKIKYRWVDAEYDFGFPLELSSSIYRSRQMLYLFLRKWFRNPNSLESELFKSVDRFAKQFPYLIAFKQSAAFSNPINLVQTEHLTNRRSSNLQFSSERLADLFEQGYRIDIEKYQGLLTNSCHMEKELELRKIE